ncbi:hypothetical protein [Listeria booriae]|uniref:hypothetical protein n=1 Tax=Listeria booriae TaxID=1552123 RepID=UPI00164D5DDC|nr:hypothetical protein [Listeria booriae]MBC6300814.1 hypothetical protein [Listeria booriae]
MGKKKKIHQEINVRKHIKSENKKSKMLILAEILIAPIIISTVFFILNKYDQTRVAPLDYNLKLVSSVKPHPPKLESIDVAGKTTYLIIKGLRQPEFKLERKKHSGFLDDLYLADEVGKDKEPRFRRWKSLDDFNEKDVAKMYAISGSGLELYFQPKKFDIGNNYTLFMGDSDKNGKNIFDMKVYHLIIKGKNNTFQLLTFLYKDNYNQNTFHINSDATKFEAAKGNIPDILVSFNGLEIYDKMAWFDKTKKYKNQAEIMEFYKKATASYENLQEFISERTLN